mmetsp:Transcript_29235/g.68001  ORF Transcript_29235/g.68001 Transcript_29235/m.68001 type:complete len:124 (+) Transcript_29235:894-1265(+)
MLCLETTHHQCPTWRLRQSSPLRWQHTGKAVCRVWLLLVAVRTYSGVTDLAALRAAAPEAHSWTRNGHKVVWQNSKSLRSSGLSAHSAEQLRSVCIPGKMRGSKYNCLGFYGTLVSGRMCVYG